MATLFDLEHGLVDFEEENKEKDSLQLVDRELRNHYVYKAQLERVNERIAEIDVKLNSIGSPKIMSTEEAMYQKGTRIYSDVNLIELLMEQDELIVQRKDLEYLIHRMQVKLDKLNENEMKLIQLRYKCGKTLRGLACLLNSNKDTIKSHLEEVIKKL